MIDTKPEFAVADLTLGARTLGRVAGPHSVFRWIAGAALLLAAALRVRDILHVSPSSLNLRSGAVVISALLAFEIFLGLWLISGALPAAARRAAIACFGIFACYTFYEGISGKANCGCFGQIHVNPWITFILDIAIVLAMWLLAKPDGNGPPPSHWSTRKWPALVAMVAALAVGLAVGIGSALMRPVRVVAANGLVTANGGKLVILDPHRWLGLRLPVLNHIVAQTSGASFGKRIASGNWVVMFYHASCDECRTTIPFYEMWAQQDLLTGHVPHVAFVRVPSGSGISTRGLFHSSLPIHATLDATHQWFARTPIVVRLYNGAVRAEAVGRTAINLAWLAAR